MRKQPRGRSPTDRGFERGRDVGRRRDSRERERGRRRESRERSRGNRYRGRDHYHGYQPKYVIVAHQYIYISYIWVCCAKNFESDSYFL